MKLHFLKFTLLFLVLFFASPANAQSNATFDAGQVFSTFKFTDANGVQEKNFSNNISGCFSLGYQYEHFNGLFIHANLGMRKAGASIIFDETNVNWNIQYADASLGVGYMLNKWRLKPYFSVSPYFGYMLKANQTIGPDTYDIMQNKSIKTTDYGLFCSPGLKMALSNIISFYAEYKYILGLQNLEKSDQKSYNRGFSINLGISVAIIKYNYVTSK
ncbi:MAG: outer membrane beta-barrel protein [Bacteroidota bacterium]|nr:outer membrane beta-barrel protein [Bacteroidota bacterium]